jgi:hypothetical protein
MSTVLFTYCNGIPNTYSDVFLRAKHILASAGVFTPTLNLENYLESHGEPDHLEQVFDDLDPDLVISDHTALLHSLQVSSKVQLPSSALRIYSELIEGFVMDNYWGRCQMTSPLRIDDRIETKEGFVLQMRQAGLPIPKSILKREVEQSSWNYAGLSELLGSDTIVLKDVGGSFGNAVYPVTEELDVFRDDNIRIAQESIKSHTTYPYSIRIITFPGRVAGAFLCYNLNNNFHSNGAGDARAVMLDVGYGTSDANVVLPFNPQGVSSNWTLDSDLLEQALDVSLVPSTSLIRGQDIIYSNNQNYFLEAQTHPGSLTNGTFSKIAGIEPGSLDKNLSIAAEAIAYHLHEMLTK